MPGNDAEANGDAHSASNPERPLWVGIAGAGVGAVAGYFAFFALLNYASLYALVIPGALIGLGRALGTKKKSLPLGVACGIAALALSLSIEWQITPHAEGETVTDFLLHLHEKPFRNVASIIAGPFMALWFGVGRSAQG